jgi:hypothetical protein
VRAAAKPLRDYHPRTSLVALENTHNRGGGKLFDELESAEVVSAARELGLALHLDGARLWNASAKSGHSLTELAAPFDTVNVCFSKGLGAPVGRSKRTDRYIPSSDVTTPMIHPTVSRAPTRVAIRSPCSFTRDRETR